MVVVDGNGAPSLSRLGSFRKNKEGEFVDDASGVYKLQGWLLDESGNLPEDKSLISSLSTININKLVSIASPTTEVTVTGLNLDPKLNVIGGGQRQCI